MHARDAVRSPCTQDCEHYRMSNALVLIVPGLLARPPHELAAVRTLAKLARYADPPRVERNGLAAALFTAIGVAATTPVAPLAFLGAGADPANDYVLCADPVHLVADRDTVVLAQTVDDLSESDAQALIRLLDRHFAEDGLRFEALRPDAWFARRNKRADIVTTPVDAARGRDLIGQLPRGAESGTWKRWQNEIQMLLHEHPVNVAREAQGKPAANAIWFAGAGTLADVTSLPDTTVTAPTTRLGDLAYGIARWRRPDVARIDDDLAGALARAGARNDASAVVLAVLPPLQDHLARVDAAWLAPGLALLESHGIGEMQLVADGNGVAACWSARAPSWRRRLAARTVRDAFEPPLPPDA